MTRVRRLLRLAFEVEVTVWVSLARWLARRPDVPPGTEAVGYARQVTPVLGLWIFASAAEIPLVHVLVPWDTVRILLLVLGVWGVLWMVGLMASYRVYPHLVDEHGIRVRQGRGVDLVVAWSDVASVTKVDRELPSTIRALQPLVTDAGTDLQVGISGRADVHLALRRPVTLRTADGPVQAVALTFLVDDPRPFVADVRRRVARVAPSTSSGARVYPDLVDDGDQSRRRTP